MRTYNEIDGLLLIDKPAGMTSADVVRAAKRSLSPKKIGHGGTLDPLATGLLVLLLGRATKLSSLFLDGEKCYSGTIRLGLQTTTDDISGETLSSDPDTEMKFTESKRQELAASAILAFSGVQQQRPPAYSAIKVDGKRSYKLAREGQLVEHATREITVSELTLEFVSANCIKYFMRCSKGTYVRSLARDIGLHLGSYGCIETLRREACGAFEVRSACPLDELNFETLSRHLIAPMDVRSQYERAV